MRRLQTSERDFSKATQLGHRQREDTPVSDLDLGDRTQDQTQEFDVSGTVHELHMGKQPLTMVVFNVRRVHNIPVSTESSLLSKKNNIL